MILILMSILLTCLTTFASDIRVLDVKVGVSHMTPIKFSILRNSKYNFFFSSDEYNFRLANKIVTQEVAVAILPPEYALKAIWGSDSLDIVGKTSKHYLYLVSNAQSKSITKESIRNKKIFLLENSADEFYLKKYLNGIQYQKKHGTALEWENSINKKDKADFVLMDSMNYFLLKKKSPGIDALRIEGGVYYVMTLLRESERMLNSLTRETFKKNNIYYSDLTKNDLAELKDLNDSMLKRKISQDKFEVMFFGLMQR